MGLQILAPPSGLVPAAHDAAVTYQRPKTVRGRPPGDTPYRSATRNG